MNKKLLTLSLLLLIFGGISAQDRNNPILTVAPFLVISPDAISGGMGDVGAATTPNVFSQYWNPAKYAFAESEAGVAASYTPWLRRLIGEIDLIALTGYYRFAENHSVSTSLRYFSLGNIQLFDHAGKEQGDVHPLELAFDAAYAMKLSETFSGSVALRFIYSDLNNRYTGSGGGDMFPGYAVAADIAAYYRQPIEMASGTSYFSLGTNISNIGSKMTYDKNVNSHFIPTNWRLGTSFSYAIDDYQMLSVSADVNKLLVPTPSEEKYNENQNYYNSTGPITGIFQSFGDAPGGFKEELQEITWAVGAEYAYNQQFFVRAGYFNESKFKGNRKYFTAGAGFKLNVIQIDAGYVVSVAQSNPLDGTLRLSLSFDLYGLQNLAR
jgi:hypothetical protein